MLNRWSKARLSPATTSTSPPWAMMTYFPAFHWDIIRVCNSFSPSRKGNSQLCKQKQEQSVVLVRECNLILSCHVSSQMLSVITNSIRDSKIVNIICDIKNLRMQHITIRDQIFMGRNIRNSGKLFFPMLIAKPMRWQRHLQQGMAREGCTRGYYITELSGHLL